MSRTSRSIRALMTCHNRKSSTLQCLERLFRNESSTHLRIEATLVDDGSSDGTAEAVESMFPGVQILTGGGSLYWSGGMRLAMDEALRQSDDFLLWLNDDTQLDANALERLMLASDQLDQAMQPLHIVVGSIRDPESSQLAYGGSVRAGSLNPLRFRRIPPTSDLQRCDVFNGNCVWIPRRTAEMVGNLHPKLVHAAGDYEYGLRAHAKGATCWIAPGYYGECTRNSIDGTWKDMTLPLGQRYQRLFGVKGQPPIPRLIYYSSYGGPLWPLLYLLAYFRPLLDSWRNLLKRGSGE